MIYGRRHSPAGTIHLSGRDYGDVSTCNLSDAMDRGGSLGEFRLIGNAPGLITGGAVTCRTQDGDWRAVVRAIEAAGEGDVLVAQSFPVKRRAILGELLGNAARKRGLAAIVVDGMVRDAGGLGRLGIPVYARGVVANAGNPDGRGKISVTLTVNGVRIRPGDMIACDLEGVVSMPKAKYYDILAKAHEIVRKENAIRKSIGEGKSISEILGF